LANKKKAYRIAVVAGDGIGMEVIPEGQRVLEAAGRKFGFAIKWDEKPWSCEYYKKHGEMMPKDGLASIRNHDAIFLGAVGFPGVPDHVSLWGLLIPIRREFQLYVNLRPVRLMPGVPVAARQPQAGDIDFWVVRENNEGEYSSLGGIMYGGTDREFATQLSVFSRKGHRTASCASPSSWRRRARRST
jgi:tartrate dehydrogenase/decarboxylase/D-malate dehydrogenase